jgi:outer membrane protein OmpA-like peptidoglycan-associated protein
LVFNNFYIENKDGWTILQGIYRAKGGEDYLAIGNFQTKFEEQYRQYDVPLSIREDKSIDIFNNAYYYIDDVSLFPISDSLQCKSNQKKHEKSVEGPDLHFSDSLFLNSIEINEPVVLNNIYFELDKAELLPASYNELNRLVGFLQKNLQMKIKIAGHTDSTGTAEYNKNLSRARAKAVVEYLKANGIDSTRLCYQGYGSTKPLDDNQTKKGRARNRRVEFIIKRK